SGSCPRPRIAIRRPTDSSGAPVIVDRFIVGDARQRHSAPPECVHGEARRGSVDEESITAVVERHVIRIARPAGTKEPLIMRSGVPLYRMEKWRPICGKGDDLVDGWHDDVSDRVARRVYCDPGWISNRIVPQHSQIPERFDARHWRHPQVRGHPARRELPTARALVDHLDPIRT